MSEARVCRMTQYWSEAEGRFIECAVYWSQDSHDAIPGIGGIERRAHYLGVDSGQYVAPQRPAKAPGRRYVKHPKRCACGRCISASDAYAGCIRCRVCQAREKKEHDHARMDRQA